ncbi:MAG: hypothetical protein H6981_06400 [Gammaproteobacteria bacterium]|nr:hypothetical protein [Gammaproteobacteria bacterium]MCP5136413.1 hypothetical protein [Gammaproteobacteria bacterium]
MQAPSNDNAHFGFAVLGDNPAIHADNDPLGFDLFVDDLAVRLIASRHNAPLTIGVFAPWGQGKSTIMRKLQRRLEHGDPPVPTVWFNPWKYRSREEVWKGLALELVRQIKKHPSLRAELKRKRGALQGWLAKLLWRNIGGKWGEELIAAIGKEPWSPSMLHDFEQTLDTLFPALEDSRGGNPTLVLFIDDLDRCTPEPAAAVLEALKMVLNRQGVITVMGIAETELSRAIHALYSRELKGSEDQKLDGDWGRNYLRKIIQVPLHVPEVSRDQFDDYVAGCLRQSAIDEALGQDPRWHEAIRRTCGQNLREIKRFLNQFITEWDKAAANARMLGSTLHLNPERVAFMLLLGRSSREFVRHCARASDPDLLIRYQDWFIDRVSGVQDAPEPEDPMPEFRQEGDLSMQELVSLCLLPDNDQPALARPFGSGRDLSPYLRFGRVAKPEEDLSEASEPISDSEAPEPDAMPPGERESVVRPASEEEKQRVEQIRGLLSEGRADIALEDLQRIETQIDRNDAVGAARFASLRAEVDEYLLEFESATSHREAAIAGFQDKKSLRELVNETLKLTDLLLRVRNWSGALDQARKAIEIADANNFTDEMPQAHLKLAKAAIELGELGMAQVHLSGYFKMGGRDHALLLELRGWLALARADLVDALNIFMETQGRWDKYSDPIGLARSLRGITLAYSSLGNTSKAAESRLQASQMALAGGDPDIIIDTHLDLALQENAALDADQLAVLIAATAYAPARRGEVAQLIGDHKQLESLLIPAIEMADGHNSQLMSMHRYPDGLRAIWYDRLADEVNMDAATLLRRIALNDLWSSKNLTSEQEKLRERLERANSALP